MNHSLSPETITTVDGPSNRGVSDYLRIRRTLALADTRTTVTCPSLPCSLEVAVPYLLDEKELPWTFLEQPFIDWLSIVKAAEESAADDEEQYQRSIDRRTEILAGMRDGDPNDPRRLPLMDVLQKALDHDLHLLSHWQEARSYRINFKVGVAAPGFIAEEVNSSYLARWQKSDCVENERTLAWLADGFFPFWQEHGAEYRQIYAYGEQRKKDDIARKNQKSGRDGVVNRERRKWVQFTNDFIVYWIAAGKPGKIEDLQALAAEFSSVKYRTPEASAGLKDFLGALCNAAILGSSADHVLDAIQKSGRFKAVAFETVQECFEILTDAL